MRLLFQYVHLADPSQLTTPEMIGELYGNVHANGWPPSMTTQDRADMKVQLDGLLALLQAPCSDVDPVTAALWTGWVLEMRASLEGVHP